MQRYGKPDVLRWEEVVLAPLGGDEVTAPEPGQRVITMMQRLGGIHGERPDGYAAYVTVPAASCAQMSHPSTSLIAISA